MNDQQRMIADWMRDVMQRRNISARAWAEAAKLGKDTVSRAIRDDYASVTSTRTLGRLAEAVGERAPGPAAGVPSAIVLGEVLHALLLAAGAPSMADDLLATAARALREVLLHLADDQEASDDPAQSRAVARAVVRRIAN